MSGHGQIGVLEYQGISRELSARLILQLAQLNRWPGAYQGMRSNYPSEVCAADFG
jgi:hypothetical protein